MAILRSYSATFEQNAFAQAAVTRYRFNEGAGSSDALDSISDLDGTYVAGAAPGGAGSIGDGAATFDGTTGFVLVETLSGTITVSAFGDSLIDGDGFQPADQQFSPNLEAALEARGLTATVVPRGVSGNTSGQGLDRIADVIADDPDVVILEFGTNDAIQDRSLALVEQDLRDIVTQLRAEEIQVLVTGTFGWYPERNGGAGYDTAEDRDSFEAIFADLVAELDDPGVALLDAAGSDKFLGGQRDPGDVANLDDDTIVGGVLDSDDPSLQAGSPDDPDGLHPNALGIDQIVSRVAPQTIALGAAAGTVVDGLPLASGSIEMWFTTDAIGQRQTLFSKNADTSGAGRISAQLREDGSIAIIISGDDANPEVNAAPGLVEAGAPAHVVFTFGAGGMQLFVDGILIDTDDFDGGIDTVEPLVIGAENGFSSPGTLNNLQRFFDGTIDEFAVYDRALSEDEIERLFEAGEQGGTLVGTAGADTLIGGSDAEDLRGGGGDDVINGNDGGDTLRGGGGADTVRGGQGDDVVLGGKGADELLGGPGNDTLRGWGSHDRILGGEGDDLLRGDGGRDTLSGMSGADELLGGLGIDTLRGGGGDDLLNGGPGRDLLRGGAGSDTFQSDRVGHGPDRIFDFEDGDGGDVLDLSAVLDSGENGNLDDFVRLTAVNSNTNVEVDPNGGGDDFTTVFRLVGTTGLDINALINDGNIDLGTPTS